MNRKTFEKPMRLLLVALLAAAARPLFAQTQRHNLRAGTVHRTMPDGVRSPSGATRCIL